ncbi:MAG: Hpt domain-containing protein [Oscillibacter sp.]|nr:Hpt domain-containing protein [Oscillibacter sp.]
MTIQELYENIGGSYESAKKILPSDKMIAKFVQRFLTDKSCERLFAARESGDETGMFEGSHAMKGVCANLGLNELSRIASEISEEYRPGNAKTLSEDEISQRFADLKALYERTVAGIQEFAAGQ